MSLALWVKRAVWGNNPPKRLVLNHLPIGSKVGHLVAEFEVPEQPREDWLATTVMELEELSKSDADGIGGVQSYVILAKGENDKTITRKTFRVAGKDDEDEAEPGAPSEPATKSGFLAQNQRHLEAVFKTSVVSAQATQTAMARVIDRLAEMNEKLMSDKIETMELVEALYTNQHERQLQLKQADLDGAMKDKVLDAVKPLLPLITAKVTGQKMLPPGKSGDVIKALKDSIEPEQFAKLGEILKPHQQLLLVELMNSTEAEDKGNASI